MWSKWEYDLVNLTYLKKSLSKTKLPLILRTRVYIFVFKIMTMNPSLTRKNVLNFKISTLKLNQSIWVFWVLNEAFLLSSVWSKRNLTQFNINVLTFRSKVLTRQKHIDCERLGNVQSRDVWRQLKTRSMSKNKILHLFKYQILCIVLCWKKLVKSSESLQWSTVHRILMLND